MDRNAIATAILLFLIVADVSDASSFWKLRYLADESPTKNDTNAATTPSSPSPSKKLDPKPDSPSKLDPNSLNKTASMTPPPDDKKDPKPSDKPQKVSPSPRKEIDRGNNLSLTSNSTNDKTMEDNEKKKKNIDSGKNPNRTKTEQGAVSKEDKNKKNNKTNGDESDSQSGIAETCDGVANSCKDGNSLTSCIKDFGTGSKELVVLVHNSGEKTLKVNLTAPSREVFSKKVPKNETRKIKVPLTFSKTSKLVLSAGNGDCVLLMNPIVSERNFFVNLPSYDKLLTPVNGAYFLIATVIIFGGSWAACCMFRKRRRQHGAIPYQELEMGLPESMEATEVETAEGWDQGWDDDWDEDNAVKSPVGHHVPNISANGLTTRSSNRDGWENDWDD